MRAEELLRIARLNWTAAVEILLLAAVIYYGYLYIRGTRGAKVLTGLALLFLALTLVSNLLQLDVITWLVEKFSVFLAVALVVIFQPELRRALAEIGSHRWFNANLHRREDIEVLAETVFQLAHRQFGSLIAIERDTGIRVFAESGVNIDCEFSPELVVTIFHPKTALHDGGLILRDNRIAAAACIFPVSQREDLDRTLGLRHRAAIGITEESDAIAVVVSEETGAVSICHGGRIERDFTPETFRRRLNQLLLLEKYEETPAAKLEGETDLPAPRHAGLVPHQEKRDPDQLAP